MSKGVPMGDAARLGGVKVPTIRYFEQIGLMSLASRRDNITKQGKELKGVTRSVTGLTTKVAGLTQGVTDLTADVADLTDIALLSQRAIVAAHVAARRSILLLPLHFLSALVTSSNPPCTVAKQCQRHSAL